MPLTTNAPIPRPHPPEITPADIWNFLCKAKWFVVSGMILACLITTIYLFITPPIYESKTTIQIMSPLKDTLTASLMSSDDLADQLKFDRGSSQIKNIMNVQEGSTQIILIDQALKTAVPAKSGVYLNLIVEGDSPENTQKFAQELSQAIIIFVSNINQSRIIQLQTSLLAYKSKFKSGLNQTELQNRVLDLELAIAHGLEFGPTIVNGPSFSQKPISPNKRSAILLALFLGAVTGSLAYYLKGLLLKKE